MVCVCVDEGVCGGGCRRTDRADVGQLLFFFFNFRFPLGNNVCGQKRSSNIVVFAWQRLIIPHITVAVACGGVGVGVGLVGLEILMTLRPDIYMSKRSSEK